MVSPTFARKAGALDDWFAHAAIVTAMVIAIGSLLRVMYLPHHSRRNHFFTRDVRLRAEWFWHDRRQGDNALIA
ncbi:MAG TPA: hypothetical protein VGF86_07485 [Candidatus Tumulicola sp.]